MDSLPSTDQKVLYADREHSGIQLTVPLIILAAFVAVYLLADPLLLRRLPLEGEFLDYLPVIRIVLSIIIGLAIGGLVEALLQRVWRSGRQLRVDATRLSAEEREKSPQMIQWDRRVNLLLWKYPLRGYARGGRERRVPASHSLFACRLLQDEDVIVAHSYLSPRQQADLIKSADFIELDIQQLRRPGTSKRINPLERPRIPAALLTGKNGQLWAAEKERWQAGFELDPADYAILMGELIRHGIRLST